MKLSTSSNIQKAQDEYYELLLGYQQTLSDSESAPRSINMMLDNIKFFWLEKLDIIEYELEELTSTHTCLLLSGAIYLNIADEEHYYFKSLGDFHLISEPLLKMEVFFRHPEDSMNFEEQIKYFRNAYNDVIEILKEYRNYFFILPIDEIVNKGIKNRFELLETFFLRFMSTVFQKDFDDEESFYDIYETYEEIESGIGENGLKYMVFRDLYDTELSLRERIERHCKTPFASEIVKDRTEAQIFWTILFSQVSQIIDTLLTGSYLGVIPYIRYNITFNYLLLLMDTFTEDKDIKSMIQKTIVCHIFHISVDKERFEGLDFEKYAKLLENKSLLGEIIKKMNAQEIDITKGGVNTVRDIILKEFEGIIKLSNN